MKKKLIVIIVIAVILGVLIPILILNSKSTEEQLIAEVMITVEDAYGSEIDLIRPGEQRRIEKGGNIVAEISVTRERALVWTEDGEYYLSFATSVTFWKKIVSGIKITINLLSTPWAEISIPPIAALLNGRGWIGLTQSEKRDNVQEVLDYEPKLKTGKSIDEIVTMLDVFFSDITNREESTLGALEKLLLNE